MFHCGEKGLCCFLSPFGSAVSSVRLEKSNSFSVHMD